MKNWDDLSIKEKDKWWKEKVKWENGEKLSRREICSILEWLFDYASKLQLYELKEEFMKLSDRLEKKYNICPRCKTRLDGCTGDC